MKIDNINSDGYADLFRRIRALETASPLGSTSVTRGRLRIGGTATLLVDGDGGAVVEGTLNVTGTETVTGTLNVDGPLEVDGNTALRGTTTATGTVNLNGPVNVNGNTAQNGNTTQNGDITVQGGGSITIAGSPSMELGSTAYGAGATFSNGGIVAAEGTGVAVYAPTGGFMQVGTTAASLTVTAKGLTVTLTATYVAGQFRISTAETISGVSPNCHIGTDGRVRRIV